jgi:hypothetical protein
MGEWTLAVVVKTGRLHPRPTYYVQLHNFNLAALSLYIKRRNLLIIVIISVIHFKKESNVIWYMLWSIGFNKMKLYDFSATAQNRPDQKRSNNWLENETYSGVKMQMNGERSYPNTAFLLRTEL